MNRRTLLTAIGAGTVSVAGCLSSGDSPGSDTETNGDTDLPDECPTTQGFDVEWPEELDTQSIEAFVEEYERVYYREEVVDYTPQSRLDSYQLSGGVNDVREVSDGWELEYSGSGGVYRPTLMMEATTADPPEGADIVPVTEFDDEPLTETLQTAAETGEASHHVDSPGEEVERYLDLLASASEDFDVLSSKGDSDTLYVDVEGTTVELSVSATSFHGDYWWGARYYVTDRVVRRTEKEETDAQDGKLLECRTSG